MDELLNENQHRVLLIVLQRCESSLRQAAVSLEEVPPPGILTAYTLTVSPEQRAEALAMISTGLERIVVLSR